MQAAAANWLELHFEPSFSAASFAYRAGLGPRRAADALAELVTDRTWAVVADIEKFFDNVEHHVLRTQLVGAGLTDEDVDLVVSWLSPHRFGRTCRFVAVKGLPQGAPIAPVLANIFLTPFDRALERSGLKHVRYADDFVVVADDETDAHRALGIIRNALAERGLSVKPGKSDVVRPKGDCAFLGFRFNGRTRTIEAEKVAGVVSRVSAMVAAASLETLADSRREINNLLTGWHNYFSGASPEVDRQLDELSRWLVAEITTAASRWGQTHGTPPS